MDVLVKNNFKVVKGDILSGVNFFDAQSPPDGINVQVTNPPFSTKYHWVEHSYRLGIPWALLMPVDVMGAKQAQELFDQYGIEILCLSRRIDFKMPDKGWGGHGAQFTTFWYTWGLEIGQQLTFVDLQKPNKQRRAELALGYEQLGLAI